MNIKITKTVFKEYTRCARFASLDNIHEKKILSRLSEDEDFYDLIGEMFDEDGEDLINIQTEEAEVLRPYYNLYEQYAIGICEKIFGKSIIHSADTKGQKSFESSIGKYNYITYLDGYLEDKDTINIFEVKSTSQAKFEALKVKDNHLFYDDGVFLRLKDISEFNGDEKKYNDQIEKMLDRYSDTGRYAYDVAVGRFFIENAIVGEKEFKDKTFKYYLVVLNNKYIYDGSKDNEGKWVYNTDASNNELIRIVDLTEISGIYQDIIRKDNDRLIKYIEDLDDKKCNVGGWCERKKKTRCPFYPICFKEIDIDGSILEYIGNHNGFDGKDTYDLINEGKTRIDSIPKEQLTRPINIIQRECFENNEEYINQERIVDLYKTIKYPIYHLDFETFHNPLPRFRGESPYMQSVFQFSLHIEKKVGECDIDKNHYEFLTKDNVEDCREELVDALINYIDLSQGGTILAYHATFERNRILELAEIFPDKRDKLIEMTKHIFDLELLLDGSKTLYEKYNLNTDQPIQNFYNNGLHGSYSIKKVLPLFSDLTYKDLEVKNGVEAIITYAKFSQMDEEERIKARSNLLKYCRQDTWAMVVVLWQILKKVGINW